MTKRAISIFILSTLLFVAHGQINNKNKNELTELQKEIETYIIDKFNCKHHISIEFKEKNLFDLNQLIANHKQPKILKDDPRAVRDNKEAFDWLEKVGSEYLITYAMTYICGTKDEEDEEWNAVWVLLLLDEEDDIIGHIRYFP